MADAKRPPTDPRGRKRLGRGSGRGRVKPEGVEESADLGAVIANRLVLELAEPVQWPYRTAR